jgi:hypothetical protein
MPQPRAGSLREKVAASLLPEGHMDDLKDNAFVALCLGLAGVVTLAWIGVVGYGVWHFLFG